MLKCVPVAVLLFRVANFITANYGRVTLGGGGHWNAFGSESIRWVCIQIQLLCCCYEPALFM